MYHFFQGRQEKGQVAVTLILGVVLTGAAILFAAGLRRYSQGVEEPEAITFSVFNETVTHTMSDEQVWLAESGPSTMQDAIQDQLDHGEAILDPNEQGATGLDDLETDADSDRIQSAHENSFDRNEELTELVAALDSSDPTRKARLIHEIWLLSADLGVPDSALETLEYVAAYDPDDSVAEAAMRALKDLNNLSIAYDNVVLKDPKHDQWAQNSDIRIDELAEQALWDPYEESRYRAIQELSSIRNEAAVDILLQAALDPDASNRLKAIECLWLSAADGMDVYGDIWANIQQAVNDPDERVSDVAGKALTDLERLMESSR